MRLTDLDIARAAVQVQMEVFDLSKLCKLVRDIFLCCLFVYIGDQDDPTFNGCAIEIRKPDGME
jgi:hypothetical protein